MDEQKQQISERIRQAQNILVTVSNNPSVDQLAAAIGLTIALNKLDKHGTAVFSGSVPSTIDFLRPEDTLEKNTDSLRDFIIALDKTKADKLRYKVEDQVVRIFITPYKTSLSQSDLDFSQGDFNVDVVVCLGVTDQQDLDAAITAHGRILHDASVVSMSTIGQGSLGTINWVDPSASSLSEMVVSLVDSLDKKVMDGQIATALLTGIVASTERFSNDKTSPKTMSASAELMAAGANQQLIATELETTPADTPTSAQVDSAEPSKPAAPATPAKAEPGTLEIDHEHESDEEPAETEAVPEQPQPQIQVAEDGQLLGENGEPLPEISRVRGVGSDGTPTENDRPENKHQRVVDRPSMNDTDITANSKPEALDPATEELSLPAVGSPMLSHNETVLPAADNSAPAAMPLPPPPAPFTPPPLPEPAAPPQPAFSPPPLPPVSQPSWQPQSQPQPSMPNPFTPTATLSEIEQSVGSPHAAVTSAANDATEPATAEIHVDDARSAVEAALNAPNAPADPLQPIAALNAQPLGPELRASAPSPVPATAPAQFPNTGFSEPTPGNTPADDTLDMPLPSNPFGPGQQVAPAAPFGPAPASSFPAQPTPPSSFPGAPQQASGTPPPPVPPPMLPPLQ